MRLRSDPPVDRLAEWIALGLVTAYWWFMARATRSLVRSSLDAARWLGTRLGR